MYFLLLVLTAIAVAVNLFFGWSFVFFLPFIVGGAGSMLLYFSKVSRIKEPEQNTDLKTQAKIVCHACCASVYIVGAFLLLVFYDTNFFAAWSFHVWIIPVLIVTAQSKKEFGFMLLLLFGIFMSLFVLDLDGLLGRSVSAIGMGSFWGFSFYFLLVFLTDIIESTKNRTPTEDKHGVS
jgi:hypothetical protein